MINDLRLQQFRSYKDESFEFDPGVNIIVGPNSSGKTNLLEAILLVCLGSSYRGQDKDLIRFEQPWSRLDTHIGAQYRGVKLVNEPDAGRVIKTLLVDGKEYKRLSLAKTVPVVLFEPGHLVLLSSSPELRRTFIDDLLEQTVPGFGVLRRQYKRTLAQRNSLLKKGAIVQTHLFAWNVRLSELGGQIATNRLTIIEKINNQLTALYSDIARKKSVATLVYQSTCQNDQYGSQMLHKLEQQVDFDYQRGFTSTGPHRDDMVLYLNNHRITESASRGEVRSLLLSLKILELQMLEKARGETPVLLLDDVFSELDGARRRALTEYLQSYQTFITTTDADVVVQHFMQNCSIIPTNPNQ